MGRWIDASPAPRSISSPPLASSEHDRAMADYAALVDAEKARQAAHDPKSFAWRASARCIASHQRDHDSVARQKRRDEELVAVHARRRG